MRKGLKLSVLVANVALLSSVGAMPALADPGLPSTATGADGSLGLIGLVLTSLGAALLRRTERRD